LGVVLGAAAALTVLAAPAGAVVGDRLTIQVPFILGVPGGQLVWPIYANIARGRALVRLCRIEAVETTAAGAQFGRCTGSMGAALAATGGVPPGGRIVVELQVETYTGGVRRPLAVDLSGAPGVALEDTIVVNIQEAFSLHGDEPGEPGF